MEKNRFYKGAGVDVHAGYESNERIKKHVEKTLNEKVLSSLGGFSGLFSLEEIKTMEEPVLTFGTDGVGTKLKLAFLLDKHDTIGIDCVAMSVNDIICSGAKPIAFLDYYACGKNFPQVVEQVVKGVADGCVMSGAALIGGETAEMPGFYPVGEYDLAGFGVGVLDKKNMIDGSKTKAGDVVIGIASSGLHSNGYSLARKVFDIEDDRAPLDEYYDALGKTLGEALIEPTKIYVKAVRAAASTGMVNAIANITGGGFYENIPRAYKSLRAVIKDGSWPVPSIFGLMMEKGNIPKEDMFGTFNMGIGMVMIVDRANENTVVKAIEDAGEKAYVIGEMVAHEGNDVIIC